MRHIKIFGLLVFATTMLAAFACATSATELTSPKGTKIENGATIEMESSAAQIDGSLKLTCKFAFLKNDVINAGGPATTVESSGRSLSFLLCGDDTVTLLDSGVWLIHTKNAGADNTGTVTSSGAALTVQFHRTVFGFPITSHCIYETTGTHMGSLVGSEHEGHKAAMLNMNAALKVITTDGACGETAQLTGLYWVESPELLYVD